MAQLHSDILKSELFADYVSIWPQKFQNKTNGITPRRWLSFCSPELSNIITKWLKTDGWVTNLDLLTGLRQVCLYLANIMTEMQNTAKNIAIDDLSFCSNSLLAMKNFTLNGL